MKKLLKSKTGLTTLAAMATLIAAPAFAADGDVAACVGKVPTLSVLSEPANSIEYMNSTRGEFEKKWGTKVSFDNFG